MATDAEALARCLLLRGCVEGIYDPPRTLALSPTAMRAYEAAEIDIADRHFKLDVRFRKRAGASTGQCDYESARRFMFSLVKPAGPTTLIVTFDPDWVY